MEARSESSLQERSPGLELLEGFDGHGDRPRHPILHRPLYPHDCPHPHPHPHPNLVQDRRRLQG